MKDAQFSVEITADSAQQFAALSGDWNPLHTNSEYASETTYGKTILHGAYSAGLVSRMAGMHLPGEACLLHNMRLKFLAPVMPPCTLLVKGQIIRESETLGQVDVTIVDSKTGQHYISASYEFSRHRKVLPDARQNERPSQASSNNPVILVTGATGALGHAVLSLLGAKGLGVSRQKIDGMLHVEHHGQLDTALNGRPISAIIHCAWPNPDNHRFSELQAPEESIDHAITQPLLQVQSLAAALRKYGTKGAHMVLVGSTAAEPGRHNYRMPLYTLSKGMIPTLARILAVELAPTEQRCTAITFDVIQGGMNASMSRMAAIAHTDRSPFGYIPSVEDAASQILWVLENQDRMVSGATIDLSGGALP
jgi:3-hydroxybutyryl-CoA dehydratase